MNLGSYRLLVHLGPGSPGDWYQAHDNRTDTAARALVCWRDAAGDGDWQATARRLRLLFQLSHAAVIPLVHLALEDEHPYAIFAATPAVSLKHELQNQTTWSEQAVLEIGLALTDALVEAHRLGLVHGRISATEIYFDRGAVRIDFAHSIDLAENGILTIMALNSPTRCENRVTSGADPSIDIFNLGALLYRMAHGCDALGSFEQSFLGDSAEVKSLRSLLESMLASDRDLRPSAVETHAALVRLLADAAPNRRTRQPHEHDKLTPVVDYAEADTAARSGKQIGRFQLMRKLGEGGLGAVFLARDTSNDQEVAIKILHRRFSDSVRIVRRFKKEARLLSEIQSPHVCRLFEFNEDAGVHYLVLEYLLGQNLGKLLERSLKLPEQLAVTIIADAARALAEAHRRGIVHRDVKPDNIMLVGPWFRLADDLEEGRPVLQPTAEVRVKLCDFGMARHVAQTQSLDVTLAGVAMGTPLYMSPEQANGETDVTPRSDVYSLGVTLFHVLTGRPPFQAKTIPALIGMHVNEDPPSPLTINADLSSGIAQVVLKALAKSPDARYADAEEFLADLERLLRGEPTHLVIHPRLPDCQPKEVLVYDWSWDLAASPAELWPLVSNTERLNQAVGLPSVDFLQRKFEKTDKSVGPRVERFGSFRKAGVVNSWREHAYEWVEGKRMGVLREYSEGVFRWFASIVEFQARADGGTTLRHRVHIVPRGRFGRIVAAIEVGFRGRRAVETVYRRIDAYLTHQIARTAATDPFVPSAAKAVSDDRVRQRFVEKLTGRGIEVGVAETLVEFVLKAPEQEVARIRPMALARRLRLNPDTVIDACLVAAHEGILALLWDILCPKCQIPSSIQETMRTIESHGNCQACDLDFKLDFANSVELVFRVHPSVRTCETGVFCVGGPAHSPHVVAQVRVAAGERLELALPLSEGLYRIRGPQLPYTLDFRVHPEAKAGGGELFLKQGPGPAFPRTFRAGAQTFLLNNDHTEELVVRVERAAPRADALTAARASSLSRFRDLFPQEVLSGNQLVSIAHVTLLTTALADVAALYEQGDARAFGVIHEHFRLLDDHIRKEAGALVKTVREGVVAVFNDAAAAVRVALDLQDILSGNELTKDLLLRIGVHVGAAMAATLNGKLDYFGATVNIAVSLPDRAAPGEIVVTQPLAAEPSVQALLLARGLVCEVLDDSPDRLPLSRLVATDLDAPKPLRAAAIELPEATPVM